MRRSIQKVDTWLIKPDRDSYDFVVYDGDMGDRRERPTGHAVTLFCYFDAGQGSLCSLPPSLLLIRSGCQVLFRISELRRAPLPVQ